jgi:hypothetical protein
MTTNKLQKLIRIATSLPHERIPEYLPPLNKHCGKYSERIKFDFLEEIRSNTRKTDLKSDPVATDRVEPNN